MSSFARYTYKTPPSLRKGKLSRKSLSPSPSKSPKKGKLSRKSLSKQKFDDWFSTTHVYFNPSTLFDEPNESMKKNLDNNLKSARIESHPSSYDDSNYASKYKKICDDIIKHVKDRRFCTNINPEYIEESLDETDMIITVVDDEDVYCGFVLLQIYKRSKSIHIQLMCANNTMKGTGKYMSDRIDELCKTLNVHRVQIEAVDSAVPFWRKQGYECIGNEEDCNDGGPMVKVFKYSGGRKFK